LDLITLANNIINAATYIDSGRKGFATKGKAEEGRISYETGIAVALSAFKEASNQRFAATADPQALIMAEYTFITQEFQLCARSDKDTIDSLTKAISSFDDAFLALKVVEDKTLYRAVEDTHPHDKDYRVSGFPKDAFHIACHGHKTRLKNILKAPGIDPIEKALLKQRLANLPTAQTGYVEKQRKALSDNK
jgi:hypothetical protein